MSLQKIVAPGVNLFKPEITITSTKYKQVSVTSVAMQTGGTGFTTPGANTATGPSYVFPSSANWMLVTATAHGLQVGDLFQLSGTTGVGGLNSQTFVVYGWVSSSAFISWCTLTGTAAGTQLMNPCYLPGYSDAYAYSSIPQSITGFCGDAMYTNATNGAQVKFNPACNALPQTAGSTTPTTDPTFRVFTTTNLITIRVWFDGAGQVLLVSVPTGASTFLNLVQ